MSQTARLSVARQVRSALAVLLIALTASAALQTVSAAAGPIRQAVSAVPAGSNAASAAVLQAPSPAPASAGQLVTVNSPVAGSSYATVSAWQKVAGGRWARIVGPVAARVGGAGVGPAREGSDYTPRGTFPLTVAFGRLADPGTAMPYFRTDPLDWWDENPGSPTYNLHVRQSNSPGGASENLYYSGTAYNYGVNIGYNLGRVPGAGSAFFLHVSTGDPTAGCVAVDQAVLSRILRWLDPAQHPYIDIRVGAPLIPTPQLTGDQAANAVSLLHRTVLAKAAPSNFVATYRAALMRGTSLPSVARVLVSSSDYRQRLVTTAYRLCLSRAPDRRGLQVFADRLAREQSMSLLYQHLCGSGEAWASAKGSATVWLSRFYRAALGRTPNAGELRSWSAIVARSGRNAAILGIPNSTEFGNWQLFKVFHDMLGRAPSAAARQTYARSMTGRGYLTIPVVIAGGPAFFNRAQT